MFYRLVVEMSQDWKDIGPTQFWGNEIPHELLCASSSNDTASFLDQLPLTGEMSPTLPFHQVEVSEVAPSYPALPPTSSLSSINGYESPHHLRDKMDVAEVASQRLFSMSKIYCVDVSLNAQQYNKD